MFHALVNVLRSCVCSTLLFMFHADTLAPHNTLISTHLTRYGSLSEFEVGPAGEVNVEAAFKNDADSNMRVTEKQWVERFGGDMSLIEGKPLGVPRRLVAPSCPKCSHNSPPMSHPSPSSPSSPSSTKGLCRPRATKAHTTPFYYPVHYHLRPIHPIRTLT
jgi:hypothetical protein